MGAVRLIFLGPPGTGKGTQAKRMSDRFGLSILASGDILRCEINRASPIGKAAARYVAKGELVPDDVITGVMLAGIDEKTSRTGFILDGFPRTVPQAESLDAGMAGRGLKVDAVIDFVLDDEAIIERIAGRRICSVCGTPYNTKFLPPKVDGICDVCGGALEQRVDDRAEVVGTRLKTYRDLTRPLVEYYKQRGLLRTVDASADAIEVEQQVAGIYQVAANGAA